MIWLVIIIICLVIEFIKIELIGVCGAIGALCGLVSGLFGLGSIWQVFIALAVAALLFVYVRPIGMKYVMRARREKDLMDLEGRDAVVTCRIDNAQGLGVVRIGGKNWSARSNRPNAVISEGEVVTVIKMRGNVAYVDIRKEKGRG